MARTVTIGDLITRSLRRADMATSGFVTSTECRDLITEEWPEVYRLLAECGPPDYYSVSQAFNTVAGVTQTALQSDFFVETSVYQRDALAVVNFPPAALWRRPLIPLEDWGLARLRPPQGVYTIEYEYVPAPPTITGDAAGGFTPASLDGIAGFDSLLTCRIARRLLQKRKADTSSVDAEIGQLTQHLSKGARRSHGPRFTRDVEDAGDFPSPFLVPASAYPCVYRIRGAYIEIFEAQIAGYP